MSDIRERIILAVANSGTVIYLDEQKKIADAVIRALGLHPVETLDRRYVRHCTKWRDNPDWKGGE